MSNRLRKQFADPKGVVYEIPGIGMTHGAKKAAPTASQPGWAKGALYLDLLNGVTYRNDGTSTSATWTALVGQGTGNVRTGQIYQIGRAGAAKAGTTAGWTVNAGNNLGTIATVAASQTAATLVVGVPGLHVGDTITGFSVYASINSGGGTVTLDANLRKITIAAGANGTDASIGSITQISVTAATAASATKTGLTEVVTAGVDYYLLLTATTGAGCTIELTGLEYIVTTS